MESTTKKLQHLLENTKSKINTFSENDLTYKSSPDSWSKKEILGHLVDSALHNLRRFVAAHYMEMPFAITAYEQDALVAANHYQELPIAHIVRMWCAINQHIIEVVNRLTPAQLADEVINPDEFKFLSIAQLYEEYVEHLELHVKKIVG